MKNGFNVEVKKRGGSLVVVLPPPQVKALGVNPGDYINIRLQRMKLIPVGESEEEENAARASPSSKGSPLRRKTPSNLTMSIRRVGVPVGA